MTIPDSTIDVPVATSSGRDNIMPENKEILSKVPFSSIVIVSTLLLEVVIGTSMLHFYVAMPVYYKVSEQSKSVGTSISPVKLCKYWEKWSTWSVSK